MNDTEAVHLLEILRYCKWPDWRCVAVTNLLRCMAGQRYVPYCDVANLRVSRLVSSRLFDLYAAIKKDLEKDLSTGLTFQNLSAWRSILEYGDSIDAQREQFASIRLMPAPGMLVGAQAALQSHLAGEAFQVIAAEKGDDRLERLLMAYERSLAKPQNERTFADALRRLDEDEYAAALQYCALSLVQQPKLVRMSISLLRRPITGEFPMARNTDGRLG